MPRVELVAEAIQHVADDGLVAYPTETVWGLAADSRSATAMDRLFAWKGRPSLAPVAILIDSASAVRSLGFAVSPESERLAEVFWPGPLTLILPGAGGFAAGIARQDGAVGVRCSPHPWASALATAARERGVGPITATSCNRSGKLAAATRSEAVEVCSGASGPNVVPCERPELDASGAEPSTVVDCTGARPEVLRWGAVDRDALVRVLGT